MSYVVNSAYGGLKMKPTDENGDEEWEPIA